MDIRKKGAICIFIYNVIGTLSVCSLSSDAPLHGDWVGTAILLTLPISVMSILNQFVYIQPLSSTLTIQFIMLIISGFLTDLILRNYSPAYIEKKRTKYLARKQQEFNGLVTLEQVAIYLKYAKDIDGFARVGTPEDRATLSVEQWYTIDNLAHDIFLIKRKLVSASTKDSIEKRIKDKLKDQAAMDLLYSIE